MKTQFWIYFTIICILFGSCSEKRRDAGRQEKALVIFDTDMGPDYDDVGALAILHAMADSGEVEILACGSSNLYEKSVQLIEIVNTYFGRAEIPVGAVKGKARSIGPWHKIRKWTEELPSRYPHTLPLTPEAQDAVTIYRKVLAQQPDNSVTIVTVGFMTNMKNLLNSPADSISSLPGKELVKRKVKKLVSMGGDFVEKRDVCNYLYDVESAQTVFQNWPGPVIISGGEIGRPIRTGDRLITLNTTNSPVVDAYTISIAEDRMDTVSTIRYRKGGRSSYDQTAVLVAVRDTSNYFGLERGIMTVNHDASIEWAPGDSGNHYRLLAKMSKQELTVAIEDLMMHQPKNLSEKDTETLNFAELLPERPEKKLFFMDGYFVWCNGALKGDDSKYHLFFSRWQKSRGFDAWVTHSEIAHAVSDSLFGPYRFSDVCLPARGNQYWDGAMTHNPHVIHYDGKYYLYYTGNRGSGYWETTGDTVKPRTGDPEWWINRNNQRVGVAVADSPYGPWQRLDKPLIDIGEGRRMTATPTVFERPDGKFSMVYKSVAEKEGYRGGAVKHSIALADNPLGPFRDYEKPFITSPKSDFPIDDHVEWYQDGKYYCIAKDHGDKITEHGIALLLFESMNGLDWQLAPNPLVHKFEITFADGDHFEFERFEMPKVFMENGRITALFLAAKPRNEEHSFSVILPVVYKPS